MINFLIDTVKERDVRISLFYLCLIMSVFNCWVVHVSGHYLSLYTFILMGLVFFYLSKKTFSSLSFFGIVATIFSLLLVIFFHPVYTQSLAYFLSALRFLALFIMAYSAFESLDIKLDAVLKVLFSLGILQCLVIIIFRLFPHIKISYFNTALSHVFMNTNTDKGLYSGALRNNVLDPQKSGGLSFENANYAAVYAYLTLMVGMYLTRFSVNRAVYFITLLIACVAVFASGSKFIALYFLASLFFLYFFLLGITIKKSYALLVIVLALPVLFMFFYHGSFYKQVFITTQARAHLWKDVWNAICRYPFGGAGFHAWNLHNKMPPHNTILFLWVNFGLLPVVCAILYIGIVYQRIFLNFLHGRNGQYSFGIMMLCCYTCAFLHGMGSNDGIFTVLQCQPILAVLLAYNEKQHLN